MDIEFPSQLIQALRTASRVAVLTGAGVSAESGIPTVREAQSGLWAKFDPQELATPQAFQHNPKLVWEWYAWRRSLVSQAQPNPGHYALAAMEAQVPHFALITQNVDGLHEKAGSGSHGGLLLELHGNLQRVKCFEDGQVVDEWKECDDVPPHCPRCGGLLRPDVVWFGEMLPQDILQESMHAARDCQVFLSIGTSGVVEPAASLPFIAMRSGALVIEINREETPLSLAAAYSFRGPSGAYLPELVKAAWGPSVLLS